MPSDWLYHRTRPSWSDLVEEQGLDPHANPNEGMEGSAPGHNYLFTTPDNASQFRINPARLDPSRYRFDADNASAIWSHKEILDNAYPGAVYDVHDQISKDPRFQTPEAIQKSWDLGTIAYEGHIPPEAIERNPAYWDDPARMTEHQRQIDAEQAFRAQHQKVQDDYNAYQARVPQTMVGEHDNHVWDAEGNVHRRIRDGSYMEVAHDVPTHVREVMDKQGIEPRHVRELREQWQKWYPRTGNILDPIMDDLDFTVWDAPGEDNPRLKQVHLKWIKAKVYQTLEDAGVVSPERFCSLVLTGSLTTYQYSADSDCDVSLFIDWDMANRKRAEIIGLMISNVDGTILPGTTHPMQAFVVAPKITKDDLYQVGLRSGYDLDTNSWLIPPDKTRIHDVEKEENQAYVMALLSADKMERLLRYEPEKATLFWHQIHMRRMHDQSAGKGDFSDSNIVYKFLNNRGLFPKISEVSGEYIARTSYALKHAPRPQTFVFDLHKKKLIVGPPDDPKWNEDRLAEELGAKDWIMGIIDDGVAKYLGKRDPQAQELCNVALHRAVPGLQAITAGSIDE